VQQEPFRQVVLAASGFDKFLGGRPKILGRRFIDNKDFIRVYVVVGDDVLAAGLRNGNDGRRSPAKKGHGQIQVPVVEFFVVGRIEFVDQVVDG
jgi:hypothetical protein